MKPDIYYINPRPHMVIEHTFPDNQWKITSLHELTADEVKALFLAGFIGRGQEHRIVDRSTDVQVVCHANVHGCINKAK